jgi:hypothetical protein
MIKEFIREKNYWPQTVITMIVLVVIACIWTIKIALNNPVQMSDKFLDNYQSVDDNINSLLHNQAKFRENYSVDINSINISKPITSLKIKISDKNGFVIDDLNLKVKVTRPETRELDQSFENLQFRDGYYILENVKTEKDGRWIVVVNAEIDGLKSFEEFEFRVGEFKEGRVKSRDSLRAIEQ